MVSIFAWNIIHETTECYNLENTVSDSVETFVRVKPLDNCNETLEYFHNSTEIFATQTVYF